MGPTYLHELLELREDPVAPHLHNKQFEFNKTNDVQR